MGNLYRLAIALALCSTLGGCGLHGARAELVRIDGDDYLFKEWGGKELRLKGDKHTRKEPDLKPGDQVQVYYTEDGLAKFIVRP